MKLYYVYNANLQVKSNAIKYIIKFFVRHLIIIVCIICISYAH